MYVSNILLKNFRNFSNREFNFQKKLNFILGENGSGKTTILEAIHYLAFTKSFRASKDSDVINNKDNYFQLYGTINKTDQTEFVNLNYVKNEGKKIFINKNELERKRNIIGRYPVISLTPDNEKITKGAPGERRNFIDKVISQTDKNYFQSLLNYNKSLKQRNQLLKTYKEKRKFQYDELLESIDQLMIQDAKTIIVSRKKFIAEFNKIFKNEILKIAHFDYQCELKINCRAPEINDIFFKNFSKKLKEKITKDIILGRTTYGPHLDNVDLYFDNRRMKTRASQGEHKISLIALKMAEGKYIQKKLKATVIYLLDDLFALLDADHCMKTINEISHTNQTIVTSTSLSHLENEIKMLNRQNYGMINL